MSFDINTPVPTQTLGNTNAIIRGNFIQLNTQFSVNHIAFTAAINNGKHTYVTMREQAGDPGTIADEVSIYTKDVGGNCRVFMQNESAAATRQISDVVPTTALTAPYGTLYAIRTMSGLIFTWGRLIIPNGVSLTANITNPIAYTNYSITFTPETSTADTVAVVDLVGATFKIKRSTAGAALTVDVQAIGI